jgi:hypothetical protein
MRQDVTFRSLTLAFKAIIGVAAVLAVLALGGCGGGSSGEPSSAHDKLAALCEQTTNRDSNYCACVADAVIQSGYDTDAEVAQLQALSQQAIQTGSLYGMPAPVLTALNSCSAVSS